MLSLWSVWLARFKSASLRQAKVLHPRRRRSNRRHRFATLFRNSENLESRTLLSGVAVNEGSIASYSGTFDGITAENVEATSLSASIGSVSWDSSAGVFHWSFSTNNGPGESQTILIHALDLVGNPLETQFDLTVQNVPPQLTADRTSIPIFDLSQAVQLHGTWFDPGLDGDGTSMSANDGSLQFNPDGTWDWTYDPSTAPDFEPRTIFFDITDADGGSNQLTLQLIFKLNNHAPILDNSASPSLQPVDEDDQDNPGTLISELANGLIQDVDSDSPLGIAITSADTNFGTWQYRLQDGDPWQDLGDVTDQSALLLPLDTARIRFLPVSNYQGTFNALTFRAWDGNDLLPAGSRTDVSINGTVFPYSTQTARATLTVNSLEESPISLTDDFYVIGNSPYPFGYNSQVVAAADGSSAIVYRQDVSGGGYRIQVQRFAADGSRISDPITAFSANNSTGFQSAAIGMSADGSFVVAWTIYDSAAGGTYFQRFAPDGIPSGDVVRVTPEDSDRIGTLQVEIDMQPDGSFALAWMEITRGTEYTTSIFAQKFDPQGTSQGPRLSVVSVSTVNSRYNSNVALGTIALSQAGLLAVTWTEQDFPDPQSAVVDNKLVAAIFNSAGSVLSQNVLADATTQFSYFYPNRIRWDSGDDFWVLWNNPDVSNHHTGLIRLQKFDHLGDALASPIVIPDVKYDYDHADFRVDSQGALTVTWFASSPPQTDRLLLQRFHPDGSLWGNAVTVNQQLGIPSIYPGSSPTISMTSERIIVGWDGRFVTPSFDASTPRARVFGIGEAAPILGKNDHLSLPTLHTGDQHHAGILLEDLLAGHVVADPGTPQGLAIVDVQNLHGNWQYSPDNGVTWQLLDFLVSTSSLLLAANGQTRLRFVPDLNFAGTVAAGLTVRAWNQSGPWQTGAYADTTRNGDHSPFSQFAIPVQVKVQASPLLPPVRIGTEITVAAPATFNEQQPLVKMWSDGSSAVFWFQQTPSGTALTWQRYNPDGSRNGEAGQSLLQVSGTLLEVDLSVAEDRSLILVWSTFDPALGSYGNSVFFQYFVPNLTQGWNPGIVQTLSGQYNDFQSSNLQIEHDRAGSFVYSSVIHDRFTDTDSLYVWKSVWNDSATVVSFHPQEVATFPGGQTGILNREILHTDIALAGDGSIIVLYELKTYGATNHSLDSQQVWIRRYAADRTPLGDAILVDPAADRTQQDPVLEITPDGGFLVAWTGGGSAPTDQGAFVRKFNVSGIGGEVVRIPTQGPANLPFSVRSIRPSSLAVAPDGSFYVVGEGQYFDAAISSDESILLQSFNAAGYPTGPLTRVNLPAGVNIRRTPAVDASGYGTLFVSWFSEGMFPATPRTLQGQFYTYLRTAPVLNPVEDLLLNPVNQGETDSQGTLVRDLISGIVTDSDPGAVGGIAITRLNPAAGGFQFSRDGGQLWELPADDNLSETHALLLAADDLTRIRFIPPYGFSGTVPNAITFRAWDQTDGNPNGSTADVSLNGFDLAYSEGVQSATLVITPVISPPLEVDLSSNDIFENSPGTLIGEFFTNDPNESNSYAFALLPGDDANQFALSGNQLWVAAKGLDFEAGSTRSITIRTIDPYGQPVDTTFTIHVINTNDAPVLNSPPAVPSWGTVTVGAPPGNGILLRDFLASQGIDLITDQDAGAQEGIAVTYGYSAAGGAWQYSLDGTTNWTDLKYSSDSNARLLAADATTRIRFIPKSTLTADTTANLYFRAWDLTTGTNGGTADLTAVDATGGSTAFSKARIVSRVNIHYVNSAPVLNSPPAVPSWGTVTVGAPPGNGILLRDFLASQGIDLITDQDAGAQEGIAVTYGYSAAGGAWQYSLDGTTNWTDLKYSSDSNARLLAADATTRIRFIPKSTLTADTTANLYFRAWDLTTGTNGGTADLTGIDAIGGSSAFSKGRVVSRINVNV